MRSLLILSLVALAAGLVCGCDGAPSTPVAPDTKMPDVSKMSKAQIDQMLKGNGPPGKK